MFFKENEQTQQSTGKIGSGEKTYPIHTKSTSDMTIMNNPTLITPMTPARVQVGRSSLNANANTRTNARDEDLHMARMGEEPTLSVSLIVPITEHASLPALKAQALWTRSPPL